jgi:hypothetical protein
MRSPIASCCITFLSEVEHTVLIVNEHVEVLQKNVDHKLQYDNRLPGPHVQLLMCKNEIALANHFFGLLAATY